MTFHAAVWLDHSQAKIFHIDREAFEESVLHSPKHHKERGGAEMDRFFHEIAAALADAQEILIMGPGSAKTDLFRHIHKHDRALEPKIVGIESADHPTDKQIVKHVREYFRAKDRITGGPGL